MRRRHENRRHGHLAQGPASNAHADSHACVSFLRAASHFCEMRLISARCVSGVRVRLTGATQGCDSPSRMRLTSASRADSDAQRSQVSLPRALARPVARWRRRPHGRGKRDLRIIAKNDVVCASNRFFRVTPAGENLICIMHPSRPMPMHDALAGRQCCLMQKNAK